MKKFLNRISVKVLTTLGAFAFVIGIFAVTPATMLTSHQPKCPQELLK